MDQDEDMHIPARPHPPTVTPHRRRPHRSSAGRGRTAGLAVLTLLLAMLLPTAFAPVPAHAANPLGSLDSVTLADNGSVDLYGWAADPDKPTSPVRVEFWDNGSYRIATVANRPRPDVGTAYPAFGPDHGFLTEVALPDGVHQLCALVTNLLAGG